MNIFAGAVCWKPDHIGRSGHSQVTITFINNTQNGLSVCFEEKNENWYHNIDAPHASRYLSWTKNN